MPWMTARTSSGSRSAIHTTGQRSAPSANTCIDALWCVRRALPTSAHASGRASSSTSTISSRATRPFPKVTTRAPPSSVVLTTKPGAWRRWTAPTSRTASQT